MTLRRLAWVLAALVIVFTGLAAVEVWRDAAHTPAQRAADALPIYLSAAAVIDGQDPTTQPGLKAAYDAREMEVRAATFSNLYPATTGVLLQPLAAGSWERFVVLWRGLLLAGALLAGATAARASVRGPARPLAIAVGMWVAVAAFPVTAECMALGQANMLMGGLMGLAMAAMATRWGAVAGVAGILGAAIKLVPGIVIWPLLAARRWRAVLVATGCGLAVAAVTLVHVPLDRVISGVLSTLRFQSVISPDWLNRGSTPGWMIFLGDLRHTPMMLWTVLLMGAAAWVVGGPALGRVGPWLGLPRHHVGDHTRVLPATVALAAAWLGADSAAFHVLYAPLYIPALVYVALWPLDLDSPRWTLSLLPVAGLPALLYATDITDVGPEARLVLAGMVLWLLAAVRLVWESPRLPWFAAPLLGLAVGWGFARADLFGEVPRGPGPTEELEVTGLGLPDGVGHGGPQPGEGPLDVADQPTVSHVPRLLLEEAISTDTAQRLTGHLVQVPDKWRAVDDPTARWLAEHAPPPPAALVPYNDMAVWLAWERWAIDHVEGAEAPADEWRRMWRVLEKDEGR